MWFVVYGLWLADALVAFAGPLVRSANHKPQTVYLLPMLNRLLRYGRNFYVATGLVLVGWMTFFDANDLPTQVRNWWELRRLDGEAKFYQAKIKAVQIERQEVLGNDRLREKFAREKYLMKKPGEDVFVIVDEHNEPLEK